MAAKTIGSVPKLAMAAAVLLGGALIGQEMSPSAAANAKTKADKKASKRVCRVVTPTGSRLVERICRTQGDWDVAEKQAQEGLMKQQIDGSIRPFDPGANPGI
jgi:hypothetical protein